MSLRSARWGFERPSRGRSPKRKALALLKTVEGTGPSLHRHPPVHRADDPRRTLQQEPLDPDLTERSRSDQGFDIHVQATPIGNSPLERRQAALPPLNSGVFAQPVLQEDVPPSWSEHPTNLADRSSCLGCCTASRCSPRNRTARPRTAVPQRSAPEGPHRWGSARSCDGRSVTSRRQDQPP